MENLSPALTVLLHVRWEMENGSSLREALQSYLRNCFEGSSRNRSEGAFDRMLREWSGRKSHAQATQRCFETTKSPYRRALLELFERGWAGEPILEAMDALESEI